MIRTAWLSHSIAILACCSIAAAQKPGKVAKQEPVVKVAALGAETRAPTKQEAADLGLKHEVRTRGQIVTDVTKKGAAAKSGLVADDVLISLAGVDVYSQDDIADIMRVSQPGQTISASVLRAKTKKEETVKITLGAAEVKAPKTAQLVWDFASLANMEAAQALAKAKKRLILVGLSGAET